MYNIVKQITRKTLIFVALALVSSTALPSLFKPLQKSIYRNTVKKYADDYLFAAIEAGSEKWIWFLIGIGANVNCKTKVSQTRASALPPGFSLLAQGLTPLHYAAICGNDNIVKTLIEVGAKINATDDYRNTPLHYAYASGHQKIITRLIAAKANQNAQDIVGSTPAQYARIANRKKKQYLPKPSAKRIKIDTKLEKVKKVKQQIRQKKDALSQTEKQPQALSLKTENPNTSKLVFQTEQPITVQIKVSPEIKNGTYKIVITLGQPSSWRAA